jgi:hypothetical protein
MAKIIKYSIINMDGFAIVYIVLGVVMVGLLIATRQNKHT